MNMLTIEYVDSFEECFLAGNGQLLVFGVALVREPGEPQAHLDPQVHIDQAEPRQAGRVLLPGFQGQHCLFPGPLEVIHVEVVDGQAHQGIPIARPHLQGLLEFPGRAAQLIVRFHQ
jgi:hypothetical protein